jgi:hypothetical protein
MTGQPTTLLSLEQFRRIVKMHPYHFWQLANASVPLESACDDLLFEEDWQSADAISRSAIRQAIDVAERKLRLWLGYDVAPRYNVDIVDWPRRFNQTEWRGYGVNAIDRSLSVELPAKQVRSLGVLTQTLIGTAAVTYSDENNDGVDDAFVATIATTVTDATQIAAFFASADRWDEDAELDAWAIRPVSVSISGGTATIRGRAWQLVKPVLYADISSPRGYFDPDDATNFVTSIAIYRQYMNPNGDTVDTSMVTLLWETNPAPFWACATCTGSSAYTPNAADPAGVGKAVARAGIRDAALGIVTPAQAVRNATTGEWSRVSWSTCIEPDRVEVRYLAGLPLVNGQMDRNWQELVTYLALAELEGPICACEGVRARLHYWQFDLARTAGANDEAYAISPIDLDNPFGTRRGHVHAWKRVRDMRVLPGFAF